MKMSVSTSSSATPPLVSGGHHGVRIGAKSLRQRCRRVDVVVEIEVKGPTDDLGHGDTFGVGELINATTLFLGQVDLRTGR